MRALARTGGAASVLALLLFASAGGLAQAVVAAGTLLFGMNLFNGMGGQIIQESAPDALRGRVSTIAGMSSYAVMPVAGLVISALDRAIGIRAAMCVCAYVRGAMPSPSPCSSGTVGSSPPRPRGSDNAARAFPQEKLRRLRNAAARSGNAADGLSLVRRFRRAFVPQRSERTPKPMHLASGRWNVGQGQRKNGSLSALRKRWVLSIRSASP